MSRRVATNRAEIQTGNLLKKSSHLYTITSNDENQKRLDEEYLYLVKKDEMGGACKREINVYKTLVGNPERRRRIRSMNS
jgi:hypothetical protein